MTDADKLRALSRYFDAYELDIECPWTYLEDIQADLLRIADKLERLEALDGTVKAQCAESELIDLCAGSTTT